MTEITIHSMELTETTRLRTHELLVAYRHEEWWLLEHWEVSKLFEVAFPGNLRTAAYIVNFFDDLRANLTGSEIQLVDIEIEWTFTKPWSQVRVKVKDEVMPSGPVPRMVDYSFEPLSHSVSLL